MEIKNTFKTVEELESYLQNIKKVTNWDYTKPGEFKEIIEKVGKGTFESDFINNIHGKRSVSANGLRYLGHYKKIKKLTTELTKMVTNSKGQPIFVLFKATVVGYDYSPAENKIVEVEYTSHSDATPGNVTPTMKESFIRIGETRAINRALINYLNVDMNSSEELYNDLGPKVVDPEKLERIIELNSKLENSEDYLLKYFNKYNKKDGYDEISDITEVYTDIANQVSSVLLKKLSAINNFTKLAKKKKIDFGLIKEKIKTDYNKDSIKRLRTRQIDELYKYFKNEYSDEVS